MSEKMKSWVDDTIRRMEEYFDNIRIKSMPETDKEFLFTIDFLCFLLMHDATRDYHGWAGLIPVGTDVDTKEVVAKLDFKMLRKIKDLIKLACEKFNLEYPGLTTSKMTTFEAWVEETAKKYGREDRIRISGFILDEIKEGEERSGA